MMENNNKIKYSIVIPVYNSSLILDELYARIIATFNDISPNFEIIFVNDKSLDDSLSVLIEIFKNDSRVMILDLIKNSGQQAATLMGFRRCSGNFIITLDDDLQHSPEEIIKLIDSLSEEFDVIMGKYPLQYQNVVRKIISNINQRMLRALYDLPPDLVISSFRIARKDVIEKINQMCISYPHIPAMILSCTNKNKIGNTLVGHAPRKSGQSGYSLSKLLSIWYNIIIHYSTLPLTLSGLVGIIFSMSSILFGCYIIINKILNPEYGVAGWNSIILAVTFIGGIIMIMLAIIGQYLNRILVSITKTDDLVGKIWSH